MKAMVLAAGRGERMRPLTDLIPKPLVEVAGKPLIEHTLLNLKAHGVDEVVINLAYRGAQIRDYLGDGRRLNLKISYSDEGAQALETAGGILEAMPLLGSEPFLVVNGDIATDFPYSRLIKSSLDQQAHLVLVPNPDFKHEGDFSLSENGMISANKSNVPAFTFSGISIYHPDFFSGCLPGKRALGPMLREKAASGLVTGELYQGWWLDIGTIDRLEKLRQLLDE